MFYKIKRLWYYIIHKPKSLMIDMLHFIAPLLSDRLYIRINYRLLMGYWPDLDSPKTFNEKLQWLKLYDRKPIYTQMVDKVSAKEYVRGIVGNDHIIPTIAVYEDFEQIDFSALPNQFVMKCSHDSGGVIVCRDKSLLNYAKAKQVLVKGLKTQFYPITREWPYKDVRPQIIIEKYMVDESGYELKDYKFFCFSGQVKFFKIDFDRETNHRANYYDRDLNLLPFGESHYPPDPQRNAQIPSNIKEMIIIAEKLSDNHPFLRVDLYNINGKVYFGELTFFPASGVGAFTDQEWDVKIGEMLFLPFNQQK